MIQTIVTPIDGSSHAQMAMNLGAELAAKHSARLLLLHVGIRDGSVPDELYEAAAREMREVKDADPGTMGQQAQVLEYVGHMLLRNARKHAEGKGVKSVEIIYDTGDAGECILEVARKRSADLIVMGSRGLGQLAGLVLGSVSHKVFQLAPCSCLTVRRSEEQSDVEGMSSILVATDGSEQAGKAVDLASKIAAGCGAKLVLLYAIWRGPSLEQFRSSIDMDLLSDETRAALDPAQHPIAEHVSSSFIPPVVPMNAMKEIGNQVLERGKRTAEANGVEDVKLVLKEGDPARLIAHNAKLENVDLVATGSRGLGGVEGLMASSVSYKVNHTVPCSCMIVR